MIPLGIIDAALAEQVGRICLSDKLSDSESLLKSSEVPRRVHCYYPHPPV